MSKNRDEDIDKRIGDHPQWLEEVEPPDWDSAEEAKVAMALQCMVAAIARGEKGLDHQRSLQGIGYYSDEMDIPHWKMLKMFEYALSTTVIPLPADALDEACTILCQANEHRERAREEKNGYVPSQFIFPFMEKLQSGNVGMAILVEPAPEGLLAIKEMVDRQAEFDNYQPPDGMDDIDLLPRRRGETPEERYQRSARAAHGVFA